MQGQPWEETKQVPMIPETLSLSNSYTLPAFRWKCKEFSENHETLIEILLCASLCGYIIYTNNNMYWILSTTRQYAEHFPCIFFNYKTTQMLGCISIFTLLVRK